MHVYRSPMEKILQQLEDNTVITNPREPFRSFCYKLIYRCVYRADQINRLFKQIFHSHPRS